MSTPHESGRQPSPPVLAYLRARPSAGRQEVMRACQASADEVRRAERWLEKEALLRGASRRRAALFVAAGLAAAAAAGGVGYGLWTAHTRAETEAASARAAVAREQERALYEALDRGDPARRDEARRELASEEPGLRLAALRYLARVEGADAGESLLAALDDTEGRVRLVALELVTRLVPLERSGAELARVAEDAERPLAERQLALRGIAATKTRDPVLARRLVTLFEAAPPQLHRPLEAALSALVGAPEAPRREALDPREAKARWSALLGGRS